MIFIKLIKKDALVKEKKLSIKNIMFHVENSNSECKEDVKSYFAMRHSSMKEDMSSYDIDEQKTLSEWLELCPELAGISTLEVK